MTVTNYTSAKARIQLCFNNRRNSEILAEWLDTDYAVISCGDEALSSQADLLLIDGVMLLQNAEEINAARNTLQTQPAIILLTPFNKQSFYRVADLYDVYLPMPTTRATLAGLIQHYTNGAEETTAQRPILASTDRHVFLNEVVAVILEHAHSQTSISTVALLINDYDAVWMLDGTKPGDTNLGFRLAVELARTGAYSPPLQTSVYKPPQIAGELMPESTQEIICPVMSAHHVGFLISGVASAERDVTRDVKELEEIAALAGPIIERVVHYSQARHDAAREERERISRELHDSVTQALFSASIIAQAIPRQWHDAPEGAKELLLELHQLTRGALAETRMLLLELRPEAIEQISLNELLKHLAEGMWSQRRINIDMEIDTVQRIDVDVKLALYRIAQEAINNVLKHANAANIAVRFHRRDGHYELRVVDDGKGFDLQTVNGPGIGLTTMRERAEMIRAELNMRSSDEGTSVSVKGKLHHGPQ